MQVKEESRTVTYTLTLDEEEMAVFAEAILKSSVKRTMGLWLALPPAVQRAAR